MASTGAALLSEADALPAAARTLASFFSTRGGVDSDVLSYLSDAVADRAAESSPGAIEALVGPFLDSFRVADAGTDAMTRVCCELHAALVAAGVVAPRGAGGESGVLGPSAGLNLETAAALRRIMGSAALDGEGAGGARALAAPLKLGGTSAAAAQGEGLILDMLWARETNRFLHQNKVLEVAATERDAKKAAKLAAKAASRADNSAAYAKGLVESAAAAELAAAMRQGRVVAVTSGSVTYVPVVDRKPQDVHLVGVNIGYGGELLLEGAELRLVQGRRYGLVGRNGYGKTTLLKAMARHDVQGDGATAFPTNIRVLHVEQEISGGEGTVISTVLAADVEREALLHEEAQINAALAGGSGGVEGSGGTEGSGGGATTLTGGVDREEEGSTAIDEGASSSGLTMGAVSGSGGRGGGARSDVSVFNAEAGTLRLRANAARLEAIDASSAESRAAAILAGLQFSKEMHSWPTKALSGGWRMRVALACALFVAPDILLLDEPTNHLDVPSCLWLEQYLLEYPATAIIVSHDRRFLNNVVTDVIHLEHKRLEYYKGDYDTFERTRAERRKHVERASEAGDVRRKHVQAFIDKFRFNAKRASLVQSRIKALERMEVMDVMEADDPRWKFDFPDPGPLGIPVLQICDVAFGYDPARPLFRGVNFGVDMESRIALVGPNGAGKSTLVKHLLGELQPQEGHVARNAKLRVACFTQHHVAQLDLTASPLDYLSRLFPGHKPEAVRAHLSAFGLSGELALQTIGTLSGGQKSRVAFAVCSWKKPHLLVLDEPTNHLDIDTIDALVVALGQFNGGVVIVSHDQHFIESVADEIWVVGEGRVAKFKGEFKDYRRVALGEKAKRFN